MICKHFPSFCGLCFHFLGSIICCIKLFKWSAIYLFLSLVTPAFGIIYKKSLPDPRSWRFTPMFYSSMFFSSYIKINIKLISVYGVKLRVQLHSFVWGCPVFPVSFVEKTTYHPLYCLILLSKISWSQMYGIISGLSILIYWSTCLLVPQAEGEAPILWWPDAKEPTH